MIQFRIFFMHIDLLTFCDSAKQGQWLACMACSSSLAAAASTSNLTCLPSYLFSGSKIRRLPRGFSGFHSIKTRSRGFQAAMATAQKKVLVPIAFGTEEMEAVILVDVLRRAGSDVTVASVDKHLKIEASRKVYLVADKHISKCTEEIFDLIVLPGGMPGSTRLRNCKILESITKKQAKEGRLYGAICAAPAEALESWGLLKGLQATCHPSFLSMLSSAPTVASRVQKDGIVTTSQGPGTAIEFALSLIEQLYGKEKADEVALPMVCKKDNTVLDKQEFNGMEWTFNETPRVLVPIANGTEEMEAVIIIDVLRRASMEVLVATIEETLDIVASRKVKIVADKRIGHSSFVPYDLIVLPGGLEGAERMSKSELLIKLLKEQASLNKPYGAICASPAVVLEKHGLLSQKKATTHPMFSKNLSDQSEVEKRVVIDGNLITSRGPGTAMEYALAIVEKFYGHEKAADIAEAMVFPYP